MPRPKATTTGPVLTWHGKTADPPPQPAEPALVELAMAPGPQTPKPDWPAAYPPGGLLFHGDNRATLSRLQADGFAGQVQMVYIDPPFKTGGDFAHKVASRGRQGAGKTRLVQYSDSWDDETYLSFMQERLRLLHGLLAETGSLFLHCDFRTAHHLRCLLDETFGADRFRNQLIWAYGGSARGAKAVAGQFGRNHDLILWYGKGRAVPYTPVYTERRVPLTDAAKLGFRQDERGQWFKTAPRGDYTDASIARLEAEGRIYRTRTGSVRIKYPLQCDGRHVIESVMVGDVWTDIPDAMHGSEAEAWAYPTRKPEALLERIIACSTRPGDLVLDAFAGSGTTLAVAQRLGRRWIGCDANGRAVQLAARRVQELMAPATVVSRSRPAHPPEPEAPTGFAVYAEAGRPLASTGQAKVRLVRQPDAWDVTVDDFQSADVDAWLGEHAGDWRQRIEAVLIDPAYDGQTFVRRLVDWPGKGSETVAGTYRLPAAETGPQVAVKFLDLLGQETLVVLTASRPMP